MGRERQERGGARAEGREWGGSGRVGWGRGRGGRGREEDEEGEEEKDGERLGRP